MQKTVEDIEEWSGCSYIQLKKMSQDGYQWRRKTIEWSSAVANHHRRWSTSEWVIPSFQLFPRWLKVHNIPTVHLQFSPFKLHVSVTLWRPVRHMVAPPPNVAALTWRRREHERILRTQVSFVYIRAHACVHRARRRLQVATRIQHVCSAVLLCA